MGDDQALKDLQRQAAQLNESLSKLLGGKSKDVLMKDYALRVLENKLDHPKIRASTKNSFRSVVTKHVIPGFGEMPLNSITNEVFLRWVKQTKKTGNITTFFNIRKAILQILGAALNEGLIDRLPEIDNPDVKKDAGRVLMESEVFSIIWHSKRPFRLFFYALWKTGCRPLEVLQWQWEAISWHEPGQTWIVVSAAQTKTDEKRELPFNKDLSRILKRRHLNTKNPSAYVFPHHLLPLKFLESYDPAWRSACERARISEKAVPYDMRRTFITRCVSEGKPATFVAKLLGTSNKMIEKFYVKKDKKTMEGIVS